MFIGPVLSKKKILNDNKKNTVAESLERQVLNNEITFLNTLINSDKYKEIKAKEGIEYWYGFDSEITSIYKLSKHIEWGFLYDHAYSYLSTSAHGTKMFGSLSNEFFREDLDFIIYYADSCMLALVEIMNEFCRKNKLKTTSLVNLKEKMQGLESLFDH